MLAFLPGRTFTSPFDFNTQIGDWLTSRANTRHLRSIGAAPIQRWEADRVAMVGLPPVAPQVGLTHRVRLGRDYYVRIDANDYSVYNRATGVLADDADGNGAGHAVAFAALTNKPVLAANDFAVI